MNSFHVSLHYWNVHFLTKGNLLILNLEFLHNAWYIESGNVCPIYGMRSEKTGWWYLVKVGMCQGIEVGLLSVGMGAMKDFLIYKPYE